MRAAATIRPIRPRTRLSSGLRWRPTGVPASIRSSGRATPARTPAACSRPLRSASPRATSVSATAAARTPPTSTTSSNPRTRKCRATTARCARSWTISTSWPPWPEARLFSTPRGRKPERRIAAHVRTPAPPSPRNSLVPRVPRPDRRHDVAVGSPRARSLLGRRRSLSRVVDSLVGFSPDVSRSAPPLRRQRLFPDEVQPRVQRAQLRHRAAVLPALRARRAPTDRARPRDAPRLRARGIRDVPAHPHAHGLDGSRVGRGNRLRLRAVPLRPDAAPAVPVLGLDSDPPRGARPLRARAEPKARRVARRLVLHERAFCHPLVRPHVDSPRGDGPHPRLPPWRRARPRRAEARRPRSRNRRNRASALPASLPEGGDALWLHANPRQRDGVFRPPERLAERGLAEPHLAGPRRASGVRTRPLPRPSPAPLSARRRPPFARDARRRRVARLRAFARSGRSPPPRLAGRDFGRRRDARAPGLQHDRHSRQPRRQGGLQGHGPFACAGSPRGRSLRAVLDRGPDGAAPRARPESSRKPAPPPPARGDPRRRRLGRPRLLRLARHELPVPPRAFRDGVPLSQRARSRALGHGRVPRPRGPRGRRGAGPGGRVAPAPERDTRGGADLRARRPRPPLREPGRAARAHPRRDRSRRGHALPREDPDEGRPRRAPGRHRGPWQLPRHAPRRGSRKASRHGRLGLLVSHREPHRGGRAEDADSR